jgi:hypothetical protein
MVPGISKSGSLAFKFFFQVSSKGRGFRKQELIYIYKYREPSDNRKRSNTASKNCPTLVYRMLYNLYYP